jgi:hypothetical protein
MAKLFTADIDKKLFEQYKFGGDLSKQEVVAKIFNPYSNGTWYLLNSDPQDPDYIWAIIDLFDVEIGSVSRNDLETIKVPPFELHLERDKFFQPMNAQILYLRLRGGEKFEEGGEVSDRISEMVKHWNKCGWASSNINNDDSEFFKRIGKSYIDTATTSFTGNDINYYDADRVEVATGGFKQKFATGGTTDCGCHKMEDGGEIANSNNEMLQSQLKAVEHHAKELSNIITDKTPIEAWVVGKIERASTDLSDITHYLDGAKFEDGGEIKNQYAGKTAEQVWDEWTTTQRSHFLLDHVGRAKAEEYKEKDFDKLNDTIHVELEYHVTAGQYEKGGTIEKDTPIIVGMIAENVAMYKYFEKNKVPKQDQPELIKKADETIAKLEKHLEQKANTVYKNNQMFKKQLKQRGNKGRDALYMYMEHWADAYLGKGYAKGGGIENAIDLLWNKIRERSKKMVVYGESGYGGYPISMPNKKVDIGGYKNINPYEAKADEEGGVNLGFSDNGKMVYFNNKISEKKEIKEYGIFNIYEPLTNNIAKEIINELFNGKMAMGGEMMAKGGEISDKFKVGTPAVYHSFDYSNNPKEESGEIVIRDGVKGISLYPNKNYGGSSRIFKVPNWHNVETFYEANERQENDIPFVIKEKEYAKGGGLSRSQKQYNKEVDAYKYFIVDLKNKKAISGWEFREDANEALSDYDGDKNYKVVAEVTLKSLGIENPKESFKETVSKMEKGGEMSSLSMTKKVKEYLKEKGIDKHTTVKYSKEKGLLVIDNLPTFYSADEIAREVTPYYWEYVSKSIAKLGEHEMKEKCGEMAMGGEVMKHKHYDYITIELIEPTNKGWKVKQIETHSTLGKKLSKPKEKIAYFTKDEIKELFQPTMAMGGKVKFSDKVKAVKASLLKTKKVSPKVQKDYGKTYSPKEAEQAAKRIVGSRTAKWNERISKNK